MQPEEIKNLIEAGLPDSEVRLAGEGCSASVIVISEAFEGKSLLEQQRMVYATLGDRIVNGTIHALSVKSYTPSKWASVKDQQNS